MPEITHKARENYSLRALQNERPSPLVISVEYSYGIYLPELNLWLDPHRNQDYAFISHAHADHYGRHQRILSGQRNATLLTNRFGLSPDKIEPHEYLTPWEENGYRFELLPAGHIWGSCMLHLTRLHDGASLLYTGDFKLRSGLAAEQAVLKPADILIMESTFGLPQFQFPPPSEVRDQLLTFTQSALSAGQTPILYAYSLGKAQEAIAILESAKIPHVQHASVAKMTSACIASGLSLKAPLVYGSEVPSGHALICAPQSRKLKKVQNMENKVTAMLTGWALHPSAKFRYRVDEVIPLSDHADYHELLETAHTVKPERIYTTHGSTKEFAQTLRSHGYDAWCINGYDQLELF